MNNNNTKPIKQQLIKHLNTPETLEISSYRQNPDAQMFVQNNGMKMKGRNTEGISSGSMRVVGG